MISQERLEELFSYDPETGIFMRKTYAGCRGFHTAGTVVGYKDRLGRLSVRVDWRLYYLHRLAWLYVYGRWPDGEIDHVNCDQSDNRLCNLREATRSQQLQNRRRQSNNKAGKKGVYWHIGARKWEALIKVDGKKQHLGLFENLDDAHRAYSLAAKLAFGEFARAE